MTWFFLIAKYNFLVELASFLLAAGNDLTTLMKLVLK